MLAAGLLALAAGGGRAGTAPAGPTAQEASAPFRELSFEQACQAAREEKKLLLLAFYGLDCRPCEAMEKITLLDPEVRSWLAEHTVAVRIGSGDAALAESYSIARPPVYVLTDAEGAEIDRIAGFKEAEPFLKAAEGIRTATSEMAAARQGFLEHPQDPAVRLRYAKALKSRRRMRESMEQFLWVFDHTRGDPAWTEVRLQEILRELGFFKRTMSELHRELVARRDRAAATLLEGWTPETPVDELLLCARELSALNGDVGQSAHTYFAWDVVRKRENPPREVLDALFNEGTQALLLRDKRYADLLWGLGDPIVILERRLAQVQASRAAESEGKGEARQDSERNLVLAEAGRYYQALLGAGRDQEASDLVDLVLAIEPCAQAYVALITAARQAERDDVAHALSERGLSSLPPGSDRDHLRKVSRTLFREER